MWDSRGAYGHHRKPSHVWGPHNLNRRSTSTSLQPLTSIFGSEIMSDNIRNSQCGRPWCLERWHWPTSQSNSLGAGGDVTIDVGVGSRSKYRQLKILWMVNGMLTHGNRIVGLSRSSVSNTEICSYQAPCRNLCQLAQFPGSTMIEDLRLTQYFGLPFCS